MRRRSSTSMLLGLGLPLLLAAGRSAAGEWRGPCLDDADSAFETSRAIQSSPSDNTKPSQLMLRGYQLFIGPTKGNPCPMSPSCSNYSLLAFRRLPGPKAFLMTVDRLNRCGHDLRQYPLTVVDGRVRHYDPVQRGRDK